eukprot:scpid40227/ scgid2457/ Regulator of G-protein signaling 12
MAVRIVSVVKASDELGYGFTVTGEQPAVLTAIQPGSAADRAGLTAGDLVLEINGQNVEEASHEKIVALVGRTRNAIQLIIVSNAELSRDSIAAVAERERAQQISYYRNRQFVPGAPAATGPGAAASLPHAPGTSPAAGAYDQHLQPQQHQFPQQQQQQYIGESGTLSSGAPVHADSSSTQAMYGGYDGHGGVATVSSVPGGESWLRHSGAEAVAAPGGDRERSRSFGNGDPHHMPRRRQSHMEATTNGLLTGGSSGGNSLAAASGGTSAGSAGGESWFPRSASGELTHGSQPGVVTGAPTNSPATVTRRSLSSSVSEHGGLSRHSGASLDRRSQDSVDSDVSHASQLTGTERHVYPVQVAYFGNVAMKADLSEQTERLRVTRDCVSECRKQHRRPQTVTMHISQKGIRLVWLVNGASETLFISRSAVALTWVDPSDHRVFSLVQRERVYNGSVSSSGGRGGASDKTVVQMKGHVFKVLPNGFDSFQGFDAAQPDSGTSSSSPDSTTQSAWPIIRLLKYMYGGKSDRKGSRAPSESSMSSAGRGSGDHDHRRQHSGGSGIDMHSRSMRSTSTIVPPSPSFADRHEAGGTGRTGSLPRSTSAILKGSSAHSSNGRSGSPESFTSIASGGVMFASTGSQFRAMGALAARDHDDDSGVLQDHLRLGMPNFSSTPHRSPQLPSERRQDADSSRYSPQARRRTSTMGNRSGSLDSVYDTSLGTSQPTELVPREPKRENRVAEWATSFKSLLTDTYGRQLFQRFLASILCEENILFWEEVERFKASSTEQMQSTGQDIFKTFIDSGSRQQVNLESNTYKQLTKDSNSEFKITSYNAAQKEIFDLMRSDSHSKFTRSDIYKQHVCLELDGKPLPDEEGAAGTTASSDDALPASNRQASTKRKGLFGFLKKDRKDKMISEEPHEYSGGSSQSSSSSSKKSVGRMRSEVLL